MTAASTAVSRPGPGLTPLGKVLLVVLVVLAAGGIVPAVVFAGGLLLIAADAVVACVMFRPGAMTGSVPRVADLGQPSLVTLVHPGLHEDVRLTIDHDALHARGVPSGVDRTTMFIAAPRRGVYPALSVRGVLVGPLGLGCALRRWLVPLAEGHAVVPRPASAPGVDVRSRPRTEWPELDEGADAGSRLREYRPGDPMRSVHWAASARHGELLVRSGGEARRVVRMAVDPGRSDRHAEAVVSAAMAVGLEVLSRGDELHVTLPASPIHFAGHGSTAQPSGAASARGAGRSGVPRAYQSPSLGQELNARLGSATVREPDDLAWMLAIAVCSTTFARDGRALDWPGSLGDGHYDVIVRAVPPMMPDRRTRRSRMSQSAVAIESGQT